ncbi:MAG TPA: hypothetical protein VML94_07750 [Thermoplasmata archaeon]|nr:hypothetical protein [Thermoplasmata archaeon]
MSANPVTHGHSDRSTLGFFGMIRRRVLITLGATVGWLCSILLYVAFWAHAFSLFQSAVLVVVSLLVLAAIVFGAWISFGLRFMEPWYD